MMKSIPLLLRVFFVLEAVHCFQSWSSTLQLRHELRFPLRMSSIGNDGAINWQQQADQNWKKPSQQQYNRPVQQQGQNEWMNGNQMPRSDIPSRYDTCKVLFSGILGVEPRDSYLSNGHYVSNCAVAVIGHYKAVHEWEKYKPTDTMWVSLEVWDDLAKNNQHLLQKGSYIYGIARLIMNKWKDKNTGEDRKQFRIRLTKFLNEDDFLKLSEMFDDEEIHQAASLSSMSVTESGTTGFSNDFPPIEDQTTTKFRDDFPSGTVGEQNQYYRQRPEAVDGNKVWQRRVAAGNEQDVTTTVVTAGSMNTVDDSSIDVASKTKIGTEVQSEYPVWGDEQQQQQQQQQQQRQQENQNISNASSDNMDEKKESKVEDTATATAATTIGRAEIKRWWLE